MRTKTTLNFSLKVWGGVINFYFPFLQSKVRREKRKKKKEKGEKEQVEAGGEGLFPDPPVSGIFSLKSF